MDFGTSVLRNCTIRNNTCSKDLIYEGSQTSYPHYGEGYYPNWENRTRHAGMAIYDSDISYNRTVGSPLRVTSIMVMYGNTHVHHNASEESAGAVYLYNLKLGWPFYSDNTNYACLVMCDSSALSYNTSRYLAGAVYSCNSTIIMLDNSQLCYNSAGSSGGALYTQGYHWDNYIMDNAKIFGNKAGYYGGGVYAGSGPLYYLGGFIKDNMADKGGDDIFTDFSNDYPEDYFLKNVVEMQPARPYGLDYVSEAGSLSVELLPDRPDPVGVLVPYAHWYEDGGYNSPRYAGMSDLSVSITPENNNYDLILTPPNRENRSYGIKAVWYGTLLLYDANNGSGDFQYDSNAYSIDSLATVSECMFSYPGYRLAGWNTLANGTGTDINPSDKIGMDHSRTLFAKWLPAITDIALVSGDENQSVCLGNAMETNHYTISGNSDRAAIEWLTPSPAGVTFVSSDSVATLSGTPTAVGVYNYRIVTLTDALEFKDYMDTINGTITVCPTQTALEEITVCQNELPYSWHGKLVAVAGEYLDTLPTITCGCDSICKLILHTTTSYDFTSEVMDTTIICAPMYAIDGSVFTQTVVSNVMLQTITGCDSLVKKMIVINNPANPSYYFTLNCLNDTTISIDGMSGVSSSTLPKPTWSHHVADLLDSLSAAVVVSHNAPDELTEGEHTITWTATDVCGNAVSCTQKVKVLYPPCPQAVDFDGNVYNAVRIGSDCWTQRNLESQHFSDGRSISTAAIYNYDVYTDVDWNLNTFGRLYSWQDAVDMDSGMIPNAYGHVQGICPAGWYLPTAEQYEALNSYGHDALRSDLYWIDGGGNNSTGFTALPAGRYNGALQRFEHLMAYSYFWSVKNTGGSFGMQGQQVGYNCAIMLNTDSSEGLYYSIRCIKEKE